MQSRTQPGEPRRTSSASRRRYCSHCKDYVSKSTYFDHKLYSTQEHTRESSSEEEVPAMEVVFDQAQESLNLCDEAAPPTPQG